MPFDPGSVTTQTAYPLAGAGATRPRRDSRDHRLVAEVRTRTGSLIDVQGNYPHGTPYSTSHLAWPLLAARTAPADTDHDGMPDLWELAHKLSPRDAGDRMKVGAAGYTMLEVYLNELAGGSCQSYLGGREACKIPNCHC